MPLYGVDFPDGSCDQVSACTVEDFSLIPGLGRSPGEGNGHPLQYSCLGNPLDRAPGGLQSMGSQRVECYWVTDTSTLSGVCKGDGGFIQRLWESSLLFSLLEEFEKDWYKFLFVCLVEFPSEAIWSWTFVCRNSFFFFITVKFRFLLNWFLSALCVHSPREWCLMSPTVIVY